MATRHCFFIRLLTIALPACLVVSSCGDGSNTPAVVQTQTLSAEFTQFTNPLDSLMLGAVTENGKQIFYYGSKDTAGIPSQLQSVRYQTAEQVAANTATWLYFGSNGQLDRIVGETGSVIDIHAINNQQYTLSAVSSNGRHSGQYSY